jgi:hypothetical protein
MLIIHASSTDTLLHPEWCHDADTRDAVLARRNVLAGLWAGRMLGLSGDDLSTYVRSVHAADFIVDGDADVVARLTADLNHKGIPVTARAVRMKLVDFHRQALIETTQTD